MINKLKNFDLTFLFLAAMLFFLPGLEALKNIFAFLFVISWVLVSKQNNNWGGKWRIIDSIFLLWILFDILISINAIITHQYPGDGFRDVIRFVLIAWVISRSHFSMSNLTQLSLVAIVATLLTLIYGYLSTGGELKELHSVGHINHTAIFLCIAYSISLSLLLFNFANLTLSQKLILLIASIVLFFSTVDTGSRATFGMLIVITSMNFIYLLIKLKKTSLVLLFVGAISVIGVLFIQNPPIALKRILDSENILKDDIRGKIRNFSYYVFNENPILGIGFGNYGLVKIEDIKDSVIKDQGVFEKKQFPKLNSAHAHNVYYTYLISGGVLLFSVFLWFWFYIVWIISKLFLINSNNEWILFSSVSVLLINLIIGWFNTTLHHEHAILSMFVLGILISEYRLSHSAGNSIRS